MRRQTVFTLMLSSMTVVLCAARCGGDDSDKAEEGSATSGEAPAPDDPMNLNDPMPSGEPDTSGLVDPSDSTPGGSVDQVPAEDLDTQPSGDAIPEGSTDL